MDKMNKGLPIVIDVNSFFQRYKFYIECSHKLNKVPLKISKPHGLLFYPLRLGLSISFRSRRNISLPKTLPLVYLKQESGIPLLFLTLLYNAQGKTKKAGFYKDFLQYYLNHSGKNNFFCCKVSQI